MGVLWGMIRDKIRQEGYDVGYRAGRYAGERDGYVKGQSELYEFIEQQYPAEEEEAEHVHRAE